MAAPVVAIDGPSGVGKGTVARAVARTLGWHFLDSGAIYRLLAVALQRAGLPLDDVARAATEAQRLDISFSETPEGRERILLAGADVTSEVRAEATGGLASVLAQHPGVRAALLQRQRDFRATPGLVADGRDMGTVVFPDAGVKVFLDASAEERARRRQSQLRESGREAILADLCAEIRARDERDRTRTVAPLRPAGDAIVIDTSDISAQAVIARVMDLIRERG